VEPASLRCASSLASAVSRKRQYFPQLNPLFLLLLVAFAPASFPTCVYMLVIQHHHSSSEAGRAVEACGPGPRSPLADHLFVLEELYSFFCYPRRLLAVYFALASVRYL
jgi:hypothetical protein